MTQPCLLPKSAEAKRIAAIFHRRETSKWTEREVKKFKLLLPLDEEELSLVERYYRAQWPPRHGVNILRTDLVTFLINFAGEVDRARVWCQRHPLPSERKVRPSNGVGITDVVSEPLEPEAITGFRQEYERLRGKKLYSPTTEALTLEQK